MGMWHRLHMANAWRMLGRTCDRMASLLLIVLVILYKLTLSPFLGQHCRFQPTCSAYFRQAVEQYGAVRGSVRGVKRICRCHPWHPGGYDPP